MGGAAAPDAPGGHRCEARRGEKEPVGADRLPRRLGQLRRTVSALGACAAPRMGVRRIRRDCAVAIDPRTAVLRPRRRAHTTPPVRPVGCARALSDPRRRGLRDRVGGGPTGRCRGGGDPSRRPDFVGPPRTRSPSGLHAAGALPRLPPRARPGRGSGGIRRANPLLDRGRARQDPAGCSQNFRPHVRPDRGARGGPGPPPRHRAWRSRPRPCAGRRSTRWPDSSRCLRRSESSSWTRSCIPPGPGRMGTRCAR